MKCDVCKGKVSQTFLGKYLGTIVKDAKGKKYIVCSECQKKFPSKQQMLAHV